MAKLRDYQKAAVAQLLAFPNHPIYPTYRIGQGQVQCIGPSCPLCETGNKAKELIIVNARRMGKTRMAEAHFQMAMNRHTYNLLTMRKTTRWQRIKNCFGRLGAWLKKSI